MTKLRQSTEEGLRHSLTGSDPVATGLPGGHRVEARVPLEAVVFTEELRRRPTRPPDHEAENRALVRLARALADSPSTLLQTLVDTLVEVFRAGSAGVSLLSRDCESFIWPAIAGQWQPLVGGGTPRNFGPCGDVLDCDAPMLFKHPERRYPYLLPVLPPAIECLLFPFHVNGKAVGTIWLIAHDDRRQFDAEDLRQLESVGRFASAAYQSVRSSDVARSLMQDAVQSGLVKGTLDAELRRSEERYRTVFESLEASEQRGRLALDAAELGTFNIDSATETLTTDERFRAIFGTADGSIDYERALSIIHADDRARIREAVIAATRPVDPAPYAAEYRVVHPDKSVRWVYAKGRANFSFDAAGSQGKTSSFDGIVADITERKQAEEALRLRTAQFETLLGNAPIGVYLIDADFRVRQVNPTALPVFGNIPDLIGRDFAEVMHMLWPTQKANDTIEQFRHTLETGEAHLVPEMIEVRADRQTTEYYEWQINRIPLPDGRHGVVCYFRDISERVLAQEKIRESEWRLRYATESARLTFVEIDLASGIASTPENFAAVMGYASPIQQRGDAPVGATALLEHVVPHDRPIVDMALQEFFGGKPTGNIDYRVLGDDRIERWIETRWSTVFGADTRPLKSFATNLDITERKRAGELLRSNHDTFFDLIENAPFGVYVVDSQFLMCQASAVSLNVFSSVDPLLGRDFEEIVRAVWTDPFASETLAHFRHTLETGEPYVAPSTTELRKDTPDLESYDWKIQRVTLPSGQFGVVCYFYDVTERKLAEDALRERDAFTRSIITSSQDCIKVLDLKGNLLSMQSGQELLGIEDIEPFLNTSWIEFWEGEHRQAARAAVESAAAGEAARFVGFFRTLRGEAKWWDVAVSPILGLDAKPARLLSVSRDVTQRRESELNLEFLASVSRDLVQWTNVDEMMQMVGARVAAHLQLSICAFAEIDETAEQVVINHEWHLEDMPSLVGIHHLADFVGEEFIRVARAGEVIVVGNALTDPRTDPEKFAAFKIASFLCVPLIQDGQWRFALCLYKSVAHEWRKDEIELTRELTARIWTRMERLRAEAALRLSERRYRTLFESIDEGFCILERLVGEADVPLDFRYVEANLAFAVQSGVRDVVGKTIRQLIPEGAEEWVLTYDAVLRTGEPIRFERGLVETGRVRDLELYAFRVEAQTQACVAVIFKDVTTRKQGQDALRKSEARFRALFDWGPIAMYSCNSAGVIQEYNRGAVALWGREPQPGDTDEQFRGSFKTYLPDGTFLPYAQTAMTRMLKDGLPAMQDMEVIVERPDGSRITLVVNVVPLKDDTGKVTGAITCFYDITERSRLERQLQEQAQTLLDQDRRKDEFLAMLSHELRNPLAPILNALHLLRLQENEVPLQQKARVVIERQVGQLNRLVGELLEISRITTGRIQLAQERILVSGIVERAVETTQPLIAQHGHELTVTLPTQPLWLYADAARLEQVLVNLLTNAAKYTEDGGRIWVSLEQEGDAAVLRVRDNGVGIDPLLLPRIFDLFTQATRSLDRSQGGLGIGLCLVQRLVELHGGTVSASSLLGQGSEFVVRLPVMHPGVPALPPPGIAVALPAERLYRVLVVDDNVDAAESLATLLSISGHEIRMAHDGRSALEAAREFRPDLALLDIGLPGLSGFEVAEQIRREPTLAPIVLVAMTGYGLETDRQRSRDAGFDHHLVKPADFAEVQKILGSISR